MKKLEKVRNNNHNEHKHTAFYQNGKAEVYPTLAETQIQDVNHQIEVLYTHLKINKYDHYPYYERLSTEKREERQAEQAAITMNISLMMEERSRIYESIGAYAEALQSLVEASESLFEENCDILNSLMGHGHPLEARLYALDARCKELCSQHPELWEQYRQSGMKYLLANQHLWPCER